MAIRRENELGRITISDKVYVRHILKALACEKCMDRVWLAGKKGRIIDSSSFEQEDAGVGIKAAADQDGRLELSFPVVAKFGIPIKDTLDAAFDALKESIEEEGLGEVRKISAEVTGVRSRRIIRRSMEVVKEYES